jgi:hypothetical protein
MIMGGYWDKTVVFYASPMVCRRRWGFVQLSGSIIKVWALYIKGGFRLHNRGLFSYVSIIINVPNESNDQQFWRSITRLGLKVTKHQKFANLNDEMSPL